MSARSATRLRAGRSFTRRSPPNNSANSSGGGILNYGTLDLTNTTVSYGGGNGAGMLRNYGGTVSLTSSTLSASSSYGLYQDNASSPVPDAAIQPSTGEVRLKLSSDGQFSSSSLSITGKVQ